MKFPNHCQVVKNYNVQYAISIRGLTLDEAGFYDVQYNRPETRNQIIDLKTSIEIANIDNQWPSIPYHAEVLINTYSPSSRKWNSITKSEWKKADSQYREYMRQGYGQSQPDYSCQY